MNTALILNFTGNGYHFGCFGTAREIYHQLLDRDYLVNYISVKCTHGSPCVPTSGSDFTSARFNADYAHHNGAICASISEADLVLINGEGTLHGLNRGPMHLLYMMHLAKEGFQKPTYLINHSCFPQRGNSGRDAAALYSRILRMLDAVVTREPLSFEFCRKHRVSAVQGFDSLPLFVDRLGLAGDESRSHRGNDFVICGGISYDATAIEVITNQLKRLHGEYKFKFLLGGKQDLAKDELGILQGYRDAGLEIELVEATSFHQWCETIASAKVLLSARFHYTVAALATGTPVLSFPSNTPKIEAICQLVGYPGMLSWEAAKDPAQFQSKLDALLTGDMRVSGEQGRTIRQLAKRNFEFFREFRELSKNYCSCLIFVTGAAQPGLTFVAIKPKMSLHPREHAAIILVLALFGALSQVGFASFQFDLLLFQFRLFVDLAWRG